MFFNSSVHGLDTSAVRMDVPWTEALIGLVEMFVLGWLFGARLALVYNVSFNKKVLMMEISQNVVFVVLDLSTINNIHVPV